MVYLRDQQQLFAEHVPVEYQSTGNFRYSANSMSASQPAFQNIKNIRPSLGNYILNQQQIDEERTQYTEESQYVEKKKNQKIRETFGQQNEFRAQQVTREEAYK